MFASKYWRRGLARAKETSIYFGRGSCRLDRTGAQRRREITGADCLPRDRVMHSRFLRLLTAVLLPNTPRTECSPRLHFTKSSPDDARRRTFSVSAFLWNTSSRRRINVILNISNIVRPLSHYAAYKVIRMR